MNLITHFCISLKLLRIIRSNYSDGFNTLSFIWGNLKPDICPSLIKIPHYKKDSEDFILKEISCLLETKCSRFDKNTYSKSERLGVIAHYLSDFFCYVHSESFKGGRWEHWIYEFKYIFYYLKKMLIPCNTHNIIILQKPTSIAYLIDSFYKIYTNTDNPDRFYEDMTFSHQMCASVCLSIINSLIAVKIEYTRLVAENPV